MSHEREHQHDAATGPATAGDHAESPGRESRTAQLAAPARPLISGLLVQSGGLVVPPDWNPLGAPRTSYQIPPIDYLAATTGGRNAPDDTQPMPPANLKFPEDPPPPKLPSAAGPGAVDAPGPASNEPEPVVVPRTSPDNDVQTGELRSGLGPGTILPMTRKVRAGHHDAYHLACWNEIRGVMRGAGALWDGARPAIDEFNVATRDDALKAVQDDLISGVRGPDAGKGQTHGATGQQASAHLPLGSGKDPAFAVDRGETDALKGLAKDPEIAQLRTAMQSSRDRVNGSSSACMGSTAVYQQRMAELDACVIQGQLDEERAGKERREADLEKAKQELKDLKEYVAIGALVVGTFAGMLGAGAAAVAGAAKDKLGDKLLDFAIDKGVEQFFGDRVERVQLGIQGSVERLVRLNLHKNQAELHAKKLAVVAAYAEVKAKLAEYRIAWRTMAQDYNNLASRVGQKLSKNPATAAHAARLEAGLKALPVVLAILRKLQAIQGHLAPGIPYSLEAGTGFAMMFGSSSMGYPEAANQFLRICGWVHWEQVGNAQAVAYWSKARDQLQVMVDALYGM